MFGRKSLDKVTVAEAAAMEGTVLLDVREGGEWAAGHAPGATHVPLAGVAAIAPELAGKTVLTICRSGHRSGKAARVLAGAGVAARNVAGGMQAWSAAGLPVVRDDGAPGVVA